MKVTIPFYKYYGEEVRLRKRGVLSKQNTITRFQLELINIYDGERVNINALAQEYSLTDPRAIIAYREATGVLSDVWIDTATIVDAENGIIEFIIPPEVRKVAAVYNAEAAIIDGDDQQNLYLNNSFYVYNEPTHWTDKHYTLPTIETVRLTIRDSDFVENELINNFEYDVAELAYAVTRTVQFWNEIPPPVCLFTTRDFPFLNIWLTGIQLFLFEIIEEHYRRNFFPHSTSGFAVDDKNKFRIYHEAWQTRFQVFRSDVMRQKVRMNAEMAEGTLTGFYTPYLHRP